MKVSKIKSNWLKESDLRFDAEFHLSDGITTTRLFKKCPVEVETLNNLTKEIFSGNIFKRVFVKDKKVGYPYITATDMVKNNINSGSFLSRKFTNQKELLEIKKDWILLSCSGTLGNVVFTNENFTNRIGTHDLIRIIPDVKKITPGYLYAFLASKYGYSLLVKSSYGGVIKHIEPHHIEQLPVPIFRPDAQRKIGNYIDEASMLRNKSAILQEECNDIFKKSLFEFNKDDVQIVKTITASKLQENNRLNGFFYLCIGDKIENSILNQSHFLLKEKVASNIFTSGRGKRTYSSNKRGVAFLSNTNISASNPFASCKYISTKLATASSKIKDNYILAGRVGQDTVGKVYYPTGHLVGCVASDNIIRIPIEDKDERLYIYSFLNSEIGYSLIRKRKTGVGQPFITEEMLASIPILVISERSKKIIVAKSDEALKKIDEALRLELKAISLIEKEIESWRK